MEMNAAPEIVWQVATDSEQPDDHSHKLVGIRSNHQRRMTFYIGKVVRQKRILLGKEEENFITFTGVQ